MDEIVVFVNEDLGLMSRCGYEAGKHDATFSLDGGRTGKESGQNCYKLSVIKDTQPCCDIGDVQDATWTSSEG